MSCIKQKHEDESDFLLDDQSEMSLSLAGLSVSRSGNCREPICTKCHVVTKMKYKFAKYRIVPISEKTAVLLSNLQSLQPIMNFFLYSVSVLFVSRLKLCEEDKDAGKKYSWVRVPKIFNFFFYLAELYYFLFFDFGQIKNKFNFCWPK